MKSRSDHRKESHCATIALRAFALTFVWFAVGTADFAGAQLMHQAAPNPGPAVGRTAIAFNVQTLDGKSATLDTFHGKPLVVNFFASWCDPCRDEMPLIIELAAKAQGNYQVLGIAVEDTRAAIIEYVKEAKITFPVALDLNSTVKRSYRIFGPPATFFIDSQGIIRDLVLGPITPERARQAMVKIAPAPGKIVSDKP